MRTSITPEPEDPKSRLRERHNQVTAEVARVLDYLSPGQTEQGVQLATMQEFLIAPAQSSWDLWALLKQGSHAGTKTFGSDRGLKRIIRRQLIRFARENGYKVSIQPPSKHRVIPLGNAALLIYTNLLLSTGIVYDI